MRITICFPTGTNYNSSNICYGSEHLARSQNLAQAIREDEVAQMVKRGEIDVDHFFLIWQVVLNELSTWIWTQSKKTSG